MMMDTEFLPGVANKKVRQNNIFFISNNLTNELISTYFYYLKCSTIYIAYGKNHQINLHKPYGWRSSLFAIGCGFQ